MPADTSIDIKIHNTVDPHTDSEADLDAPAPSADLVRVYLDEIGRTPLLTAEEEVDLSKRIEAGLYAEHLLAEEADGSKRRLSATRRRELRAVAADGQTAKAAMISANLRLVVSIARKFGQRGVPMLDVVQEGNLGLIRAVEKFDYRKGYKFSTYATWWIRQSIGRGISEQARTIRLPVHVTEAISKIARAQRQLVQELGREVTDEDIAASTGLDVERVVELRAVTRDALSLDTPVGEGETSVGDLVADTGVASIDEVIDHAVLVEELHRTLDELPERERRIISLRFGLEDGRQHTLDEVGRVVGLTRERVRQLERDTLRTLSQPEHRERLLDWAS
ncbi:MAG TPA: sigma-70 family RNA polymerase sigma factor [Actinomycetes bacterium]|nr:sigma-70 family RNA polymerase sigma factor [Actinomycetes bacterium]